MGETKTPNFYDFGIFERVPKPQNQLFLSLETPGHLKNQENSLEHFFKILFVCISKFGKIHNFDIVGKDGHRQIPKIRLISLRRS